MKKILVLALLFLLPITAYLFFSSGVNNFARLPVLTQQVKDIAHLTSNKDTAVTFEKKISIVGFFGTDLDALKGNTFNLDQKILGRFYEFKDFQFVIILPESTRSQSAQFVKDFEGVTNPEYWTFVYGTEQQVQDIFDSFETDLELDENYQTPYVFIVDKEKKLRGRDDEKDEKKSRSVYGYDSRLVSELNSKMNDDVKVILAEYRLALKKNDPYREDK